MNLRLYYPLVFMCAAGTALHPAPADDLFGRIDKNKDGRIGRDEARGTAAEFRFDALDRNKDGFVTPQEMPHKDTAERASVSPASASNESRRNPPAAPVKPSAMPAKAVAGNALDTELRWEKSLALPLTDKNGKTLVGTEIMEIVAHGGKLYAGNSHWGDDDESESSKEKSPTQVFVKESADAPWRVDVELGAEYTRTSFLKEVVFTTDAQGAAMKPCARLILGVNRARVRGGRTPAVIFIRDDTTGKWIERTLGMSDTTRWAVAVRSIGFHRDKMIGADMLFLGAGPGAGIYTGVFDASEPGGIRFGAEPEFRPVQNQRIMDFCEAGGILYAATQKVLYKRAQDGKDPKWVEVVDTMTDRTLRDRYGAGINPGWVKYDHFRAFAADRDPVTGNDALLFGALNRVFRLDPATDRFEPEVDIRELFEKQLGMKIHYAQTQHNDRIRRPDGSESRIIGLEVMFEDDFIAGHPEVPVSIAPDRHWEPPKNVYWAKQGFYLERRREGGAVRYAVREIHDATRATPDWLARVRSMVASPFPPEQGRVIYASGFAPWGVKVANTGWVYRGEFQTAAPKGEKP